MSLTNQQYRVILREYDQFQYQSSRDRTERKAEIYRTIPEFQALDEALSSLGRKYMFRLMDADDLTAKEDLHAERVSISAKKKKLLLEHGYRADYLDPQYRCPDCRDTGFIGTRKCHCFTRRMTKVMYEQSHIMDLLQAENFDTLSYEYHTGKALEQYRHDVEVCKEFADNFDNHSRSLLFTGTVGTGKSFLSNCIAKALLDTGHSVIYYTAVDLFEALANVVFDRDTDSEHALLSDLYQYDLVIIDDLGTEMTNSFVSTYLFTFLNGRSQRGKSTIISTNLDLSQIRDRYSDRTFSRIVSNFDVIAMEGNDIRMLK